MRRLMLGVLLAGWVPAATVPILLDTDIGTDVDDAFALALVLTSPELELRGLTTVGGDAWGRALIACRYLEAAGRGDVPVASGRPARTEPESKGQFGYGLGGDFSKRPVEQRASEFLYSRLKGEPGRLTLVAIGELTNVARLLGEHPDAARLLRRIVIMGGAVRIGYNGKPPASWEWNIHTDIAAAQRVFASGVALTVAPLDATTMVKLDGARLESVLGFGAPLNRDLAELHRLWGKQAPTLFDPVAVALAIGDGFCRMEELRIEVDAEGITRERSGAPNARVAVGIDRDAFLDWYAGRLTRRP